MQIAVTTPDDKPIGPKADRSVSATIAYGKRWDGQINDEGATEKLPTEKVLTLSADGTTNLTIVPPVNTTNININVYLILTIVSRTIMSEL